MKSEGLKKSLTQKMLGIYWPAWCSRLSRKQYPGIWEGLWLDPEPCICIELPEISSCCWYAGCLRAGRLKATVPLFECGGLTGGLAAGECLCQLRRQS